MQTTTTTLTALPVAGALLLLPVLLNADLVTPDRITPLASDYLQTPETSKSAADAATASDSPVTALPPIEVKAVPFEEIELEETATSASRAKLAEELYFTGATDTLNRITLPLFGRDRQTVALERLREDERIAAIKNLDRQIELTALADPKTADELADLRYSAFIRSEIF